VERVSGDESLPPIITFTNAEGALGFYYEGTNQIHISPHALSTGTVNPPSQGTGFVYVVIGHEMFHYAYRRSIPMERHHFYFKHYLQDRLIKWLVDKEIVLPIMGRIIKGMEMEE
jgi:hypothetical protein